MYVLCYQGNGFPEEYDATIFDKYRQDITVDGKVTSDTLYPLYHYIYIERRERHRHTPSPSPSTSPSLA